VGLRLVLAALLVSCSGSSSQEFPYPDQEPTVDAEPTTDGITLVDEAVGNGWRGRFYHHQIYTCAESGQQSFVLLSPEGVDDSESRPLWLYLHGGGGGGYLEDGSYDPVDLKHYASEDSAEDLIGYITRGGVSSQWPPSAGLPALVAGAPEGFRFLLVSMCDHDTHSGVGAIDEFNPNSYDVNGNQRRTDGLLANLAALEYVRDLASTSHVFAHGCSAGSVGTMTLVHALGRAGQTLSGAVPDSYVASYALQGLWELKDDGDACFSNQAPNPEEVLFPRIGAYMEPGFFPHEAILDDAFETPVFGIYSENDSRCCGEHEITIGVNGDIRRGAACDLVYEDIMEAIPGHAEDRSEFRRVCVGPNCDSHCSTLFDMVDQMSTNHSVEIYDWVRQRLAEPVP